VGCADWPDGADFKTVNGEITPKLPRWSTVSAPPLTAASERAPITEGQVEPPSSGTLGSGGRQLALTVNAASGAAGSAAFRRMGGRLRYG
jgi:hypothetical protein